MVVVAFLFVRFAGMPHLTLGKAMCRAEQRRHVPLSGSPLLPSVSGDTRQRIDVHLPTDGRDQLFCTEYLEEILGIAFADMPAFWYSAKFCLSAVLLPSIFLPSVAHGIWFTDMISFVAVYLGHTVKTLFQ